MKIIKTFCLVTLSLCSTILLHAQEEVTGKIVKPVELKTPAPMNNKPLLAPDVKPQPAIAFTKEETGVTPSKTPSPFNKDENIKTAEAAKPILTAEEAKILAGKSERPKPLETVPVVNEETKPQIIVAPAVLKEQ